MDPAFLKLCKEINFTINDYWKESVLTKAELNDGKEFYLSFELKRLVPIGEMKRFIKTLNDNFPFSSKPHFKLKNKIYEKQMMLDYVIWVLESFVHEHNLSFSFQLSNSETDINGNLVVFFKSISHLELFNLRKKRLLFILSFFGFEDFDIIGKRQNGKPNFNNNPYQKEVENFLVHKSQSQKQDKFIANNRNFFKTTISDARVSNEVRITLEGQIFKIKEVITKTKALIFTVYITDFKEAIIIKKFLFQNNNAISFWKSLELNNCVEVSGKIENDKYLNDLVIKADFIKKIDCFNQKNSDQWPTKRIEFNTRTNMSVMDGLVSPKELYDRAKLWNHSALAITDLNNVQAFPAFLQATQKDPEFKAIYGSTFQIFNDSKIIDGNPPAILIDRAKYVIFDLETTGLSARYNDIIEFGAVKIENNQIVDKLQFLIKSDQPISDHIQELTKITNDMLKTAISEEKAMKLILEFFGDAILIAHNAKFDMSFLRTKVEKYHLTQINNVVIDTLFLSRVIDPKVKRHSLEYVALRYQIDYNGAIAHRADYDAEVLGNIWLAMCSQLKELGYLQVDDLVALNNSQKITTFFPNQLSIIAKNKAGLRNLYQLISLAHTENFNNFPGISKANLITHRDGLLVGSGIENSLVINAALNHTQAKLEEEINFYDYIEIPPLGNFSHLISRGEFSLTTIENCLKNIILTAKKLNKIVIAVTGARYLNRSDSYLHRIYIESKGLGGALHSLYKYRETNPDYPKLYFLNTSEMVTAFNFLNDDKLVKKIVIDNTHKLANLIDKISPINNVLAIPQIENSATLLQQLVFKHATARYGTKLPTIVKERLDLEFRAILKYDYNAIYWIAHQLVEKSLNDGYLVGSRGSVGSSLVANLVNITEVNPLPPHYYCPQCQYTEFYDLGDYSSGYDLPDKKCHNCQIFLNKDGHTIPFATFLGFNGEKIPDIDLNFSGEYQNIIHEEVRRIFGVNNCFRAGTVSTVAERTAFGYIKAWAEKESLELSKPFIEFLAVKISGVKRTTGQHPGGIVVLPQNYIIEDFTPINFPANDVSSSWKTTHFDFNALHSNLLKLDLLGHDDPTAIRMLQDLTGVKPETIPNSDPKVIALFSNLKSLKIKPEDISGETTGAMGIPEFGTEFVRGILKKVKVKSFADLISVSGLSHGTQVWSSNSEVYIKIHNLKLNQIISCRDDIMLTLISYQIPSKTAFTIMEQIRKGQSITIKQEKIMKEANVPDWYIESCKKIKYLFPKAHATAYVKMAWKIAWFKIYYPLEYYAVFFSTRANAFDLETFKAGKNTINLKLKELKTKARRRSVGLKATKKEEELIPVLEITQELYARGFQITNVDLQHSDSTAWKINHQTKSLIPPFLVLDGLGKVAAKSIIKARNEKIFSSREDLERRTLITKTNIQDLVSLGALDTLPKKNQLSLFD